MRKILVGAVAGLAVAAFSVVPASAGGDNNTGFMTVSAEVSYVGETVEISNSPDELSTCEAPIVPTAGDSIPVEVWLQVEDPNGDLIVDEFLSPDVDGNWSYEVGPLEDVGVYTAYAECNLAEEPLVDQASPSALPYFDYVTITFEVIAPGVSTSIPGVIVSTTTTAAAAAATATPRFTG